MSLTAALWIGSALVVIIIIVISGAYFMHSHTDQTIKACDHIKNELQNCKMNDPKETLVLQMEISKQYHKDVLFRANFSFFFALVFAGMGILLFFSIIIFMV